MVAMHFAANPQQLSTALAPGGGAQPGAPTGAQPGAGDPDPGGFEEARKQQAHQQCLSQCDSTPFCPSDDDFNACISQHNTDVSNCRSRCQ
jgi:hypothetical protein